MWATEKIKSLPRTKNIFYITSSKGEIFLVKPGKAFSLVNGSWNKIRATSQITNKVDRAVISPCGGTSLHLPKFTPALEFHENHGDPFLVTIPLPRHDKSASGMPSAVNATMPSGESLTITNPSAIPKEGGNVTFGKPSEKNMFSKNVHGIAISEDGRALALAVDNQFWVWQQLPEQIRGIGFWTNLTADQRFAISVQSNHPNTANSVERHGYMRLRQSFTLHPVLAPNVPQNSAISFQDLCLFSNPDEGVGLCCLTALLPPCKPFNTLYLFNSICTFKGFTPKFERADCTIPVVEGYGAPCIWWSIDCRFAVIAVSESLVIVTRHLHIIKILPLKKVFAGEKPIVASVGWSCSGEFFVLASKEGVISVVSRCGKSMRHCVCDLAPFTAKTVPLLVTGDSKDPSLFIIYSAKKMRLLKIDPSMVPRSLDILMSLHFPHRTISHMYETTVKAIKENGIEDPISLVRLLYLTGIYRIFPYYSPLRYILLTLFDKGSALLLQSNNNLLAFLVVRCIFRLTEIEVPAYRIIAERLSYSSSQRDKLLLMIMNYEANKQDYLITKNQQMAQSVQIYDIEDDDDDEQEERLMKDPPLNGSNVNISELTKTVKNILYQSEIEENKFYDTNFNLLLEILIETGRFDKAIALARHPSIACEPPALFVRVASLHPSEADKLYQALESCIEASPEDEIELRAVCVKAIVNILKEKISNTMPSSDNKKVRYVSTLAELENGVELVCPDSSEQCNDFAVILSIGFAAADYSNCAHYFNQEIAKIPSGNMREALHELFGIAWFVKWRFQAIAETAKTGRPNNATLRLIAFPDFINISTAKNQIDDAGIANFSHMLYTLYMNELPRFEKDPEFPDFASECSQQITPRGISRIQATVKIFQQEEGEIPRSNLLLATVVSHIVPWLRCGLTRALTGFMQYDEIPKELLDLEELDLPDLPPPRMELTINKTIDLGNETEVEEDDDNSEGEYVPPKKRPRRSASSVSSSSSRRVRSRPKKRRSHRPEYTPRREEPKRPLPILTVDPTSVAPPLPPMYHNYVGYPQPQPMIPPPPIYQQYVPTMAAAPMIPAVQENPCFAPIWDFDPNSFTPKSKEIDQKPPPPAPSAPPPVQQRPATPPSRDEPQKKKVYVNSETQMERESNQPPPRPKPPLIVFASKPQPRHDRDLDTLDLSISSELSELDIPEPVRRPAAFVNPFPLDDGLHSKVEKLLDEVKATPDAPELPEKPKFVPPPITDIPINQSTGRSGASHDYQYQYDSTYYHSNQAQYQGAQMPSYQPAQVPPFSMQMPQFQTDQFGGMDQHASIPPISLKKPEVARPAQRREAADKPDFQPPDWRPSVVSMRDAQLLGVQEITIDQFHQNPSNRTHVQLQELQPT